MEENINDIQSIEKLYKVRKITFSLTDESKLFFFVFNNEAKLEITLILSKINTRIRL